MSVSCEEVRELLPRYADWGPRPAGAVEVHLATCADCSAQLAAYRRMMGGLTALRSQEVEPPAGYLERALGLIPNEPATTQSEWRRVQERVDAAARRRPAVASLTGAVIGAAAIGLVVWRRGRKALGEAARVPELATR